MGKYRLKSKQKGSVITLMEVDTECQAWYIQADDMKRGSSGIESYER